MNESKQGYRGYIGSRAYEGLRTPQHIQNLVIRDFCQRQGKSFLLSATEYAIPGCYIMLNTLIEELPQLKGIVMYSLSMMPRNASFRQRIFKTAVENAASLHFALENITALDANDFRALEDHIMLSRMMNNNTTLG